MAVIAIPSRNGAHALENNVINPSKKNFETELKSIILLAK